MTAISGPCGHAVAAADMMSGHHLSAQQCPKAFLLSAAAQPWLLRRCIGCAGLLFCEEGLDVEEAGLCGGSEGDYSPRCFEDLGDDSLSMSASTSDSQHSEGAPALILFLPLPAPPLV